MVALDGLKGTTVIEVDVKTEGGRTSEKYRNCNTRPLRLACVIFEVAYQTDNGIRISHF